MARLPEPPRPRPKHALGVGGLAVARLPGLPYILSFQSSILGFLSINRPSEGKHIRQELCFPQLCSENKDKR